MNSFYLVNVHDQNEMFIIKGWFIAPIEYYHTEDIFSNNWRKKGTLVQISIHAIHVFTSGAYFGPFPTKEFQKYCMHVHN